MTLTGIVLAAATLMAATEPAAQPSSGTVMSFAENGVVGRLFLPAGSDRRPAVIVIGGSEGGVEWSAPWGVPLAQHGFVVLALAYFGTDPLPARLQSIPLEYFTRAIESLQRHPLVDSDRVGLMGFSKGAEGALLIAATHPSIRAVIASAPSHVAWPGITGNPRDEAPSWTVAGVAVPFVPYNKDQTFATSLEAYTHSLADDGAVATAAIRVERINGPILLLSGTDDRVWPATAMAERIMERLRRHQFRFPATHRRFDGAGHAVLTSPGTSGAALSRLGGTPGANAQARSESSRLAVEFLERALIGTREPARIQSSPAASLANFREGRSRSGTD